VHNNCVLDDFATSLVPEVVAPGGRATKWRSVDFQRQQWRKAEVVRDAVGAGFDLLVRGLSMHAWGPMRLCVLRPGPASI
jgi:hypothetical protein